MTIDNFILLDENDQKRVIWDGAYLGMRLEADKFVQLYALGNFYVEVHFSPTTNKILSVEAFKTLTLLQPYLDQIVISYYI